MEAHALRAHGHGARAKAGPLRRIASDDRLVELVRADDPSAFEVLFERYQRPILSFCRHMLGSREEAEDAAQHVFLSAYNGIRSGDRHIQLRPWLYTVARNQCLTQLRARREQASLEDVEPSVEGLASEVQRRADLRDMLRDLARLPEDQRAALVLAELGDLPHDDIADVVGCPKDKVKALVFQARSSLAASRQARDTSCQEIREQLATLKGGSLRRTTLRRHLRECAGCRDFRDTVKQQRAAMAVLLPVVPTAGLKAGVLSGIGASKAGGAGAAAGAAGAASGGGGLVSALAGGGAAKLAVVAAVAAGGVGGGVAAVKAVEGGGETTPKVTPTSGSSAAEARQALTGTPTSGPTPSGVDPVRARGEHAPGKQAGGVANGKNPKGDRGRSATAPGRAGTSPGRAGTSPGRAGKTPGQVRRRMKAKSNPNRGTRRSGSAPGRTRSPAPTPTPAPSGGSGGGGNSGSGGGGSSSGGGSGGATGGGNSGIVPDVTKVVPKVK